MGITDERVDDSRGMEVESASTGDSILQLAGSPFILDGGEEPSLADDYFHEVAVTSPGRVSNASRLIRRKRTRSPGRNSVGGSFSGLNNRTRVRPITFQPPGETIG